MRNEIASARPSSTFESFEATNDSLRRALEVMQGLGNSIVQNQDAILREQYPFESGALLFFNSEPGRGKTHLLEALINHVKRYAPAALRKMFLLRYDFVLANIASVGIYENCPIILVDDIFVRSQSVNSLNPATDIRVLMDFIMMVYETRRLVVFTSNFPLKDGLARRIMEVDQIGRVTSRLKEMLPACHEFNLEGDDFRGVISQRRHSKGGINPLSVLQPGG